MPIEHPSPDQGARDLRHAGYLAAWQRLRDVGGDLTVFSAPLSALKDEPRPLSGAALAAYLAAFPDPPFPLTRDAERAEWAGGLGMGAVDVMDRLLPDGMTLDDYAELPADEQLRRSMEWMDERWGERLFDREGRDAA